ncbi:MAG: zf-HC2 domain-containing protein [Elusimicrobia bacterium]|nr:zf-HC2 domain-containing protein [Elusimicrobiota bacterium]
MSPREPFRRAAHLNGMDLERLSCRRRVALLCDYLDGELPPHQRRVVTAHRRSCLPCGKVLESLERTVAALRCLKGPARPPTAARRCLRAALSRAAAPKTRRRA